MYGKQMILLLAEDDAVSRAFMTEVLTSAGHEVVAVADGRHALAQARGRRFDCLLLDLNLPEICGDAVLAALRPNGSAPQVNPPASSATPAVLLSADMAPARRRSLLAAGFARVVSKPVSADDLLAAIHGKTPSIEAIDETGLSQETDLDDAAALRIAGGVHASVDALRGLMLSELPAQQQRLRDAFSRGDSSALAGELHRLRAACGFCGASRLGSLAQAMSTSMASGDQLPDDDAMAMLISAADALLQRLGEVAPGEPSR